MIQGENLLGLGDILNNDNLRLDSLFENHNNIGRDENVVYVIQCTRLECFEKSTFHHKTTSAKL